MIGLVALALAAAQSPAPVTGSEVVVTARSLTALRDDWQVCIDRGCPPKVEMDRAMAYAEAQLIDGDYPGGWRTLRRTKGRNLKHADTLPIDVARIARASSRMASLNGEPLISRVNAFETVDSLRAGLDSEDARILVAKLDIGDSYIADGKTDFALAKYVRVAKEAKRKALPYVVAEAAFRRAALMTALAQRPGGYRPSAQAALREIIGSPDPVMASYRDAAQLVALNLLPEREQRAAVERLLPTLKPRAANNLLLAYAPPIDFDKLVVTVPPRGATQQWVDLHYRIARDGTVHDIVPARRSEHIDPVLVTAAATSLGERRYAPLAVPEGDPGFTRYARYSFIADPEDDPASRINNRSARPRVDVFDLGTELVRRD